MPVSKTVKFELLRVKASRLVRGAIRRAKVKMEGGNAGSAESIFGEDIRPLKVVNREKRAKSTLVVFVSSTAMGVSHAAASGFKYGVKTTRNGMILGGLATGLISAGVWYNYVDAAEDDITEDDIMLMFELADGTTLGTLSQEGDSGKAFDILHAIVTNDFSEVDSEDSGASKGIKFEYESEDDDDDDDEEFDEDYKSTIDKDDPYYKGGKVDFNTEDTSSSSSSSTRTRSTNPFGKTRSTSGVGSSLEKYKANGGVSSFVPPSERDDIEQETPDEWLDVKNQWQ